MNEIKKIVIFGATSAIATEAAIIFAKHGAKLLLVARNGSKLEAIQKDLNTRFGINAETYVLDANEYDKHEIFIQDADRILGGFDAILIAHGTLPDNESIKNNPAEVVKEFNTNAMSIISLATAASKYFEEKKSGVIAVISSVAGDRGRQSNYIYGAAKGAVTVFLQGLRNRLFHSGVHVVTIKPGFVDTPMTKDVKKNFLFATASQVAKGIYNAMTQGKNTVYLPGFWKFIMLIIKNIPENIFKKLKL